MSEHLTAEVAVIGGGPAGSALATRLASAGIDTLLFERSPEPKWRACGVFSSPLARGHLRELGVLPPRITDLNRPIAALELESISGSSCRIEYTHGHACGFDRPALDADLLSRARQAGAHVRTGVVAHSLRLSTDIGSHSDFIASPAGAAGDADPLTVSARVVVGADGSGSLVGRAANVVGRLRWLAKSGVTFHRSDPAAVPEGEPMVGRFVFGEGWYVGVAPVPGARVNVGMVLPPAWLSGPVDSAIERAFAQFPEAKPGWMSAAATDAIAIRGRLTHRVTRVAGAGFVLVGDAAGFIDPLSGEGLNRAFVTAELAAHAIGNYLRGDRDALEVYDRRVRSRFFGKNLLSWILQGFLMSPRFFDYTLQRLARRARLRDELTLVLTDQRAASRVINPAYLTRLLAP